MRDWFSVLQQACVRVARTLRKLGAGKPGTSSPCDSTAVDSPLHALPTNLR